MDHDVPIYRIAIALLVAVLFPSFSVFSSGVSTPKKGVINSSSLEKVTSGMAAADVKELLGEPARTLKANLKKGIPTSWQYLLDNDSSVSIYFRQGKVETVSVAGKILKLPPKTIRFERIDQLQGKQFFILAPVYVAFTSTDPVTYVSESAGLYYLQTAPNGITLEYHSFDASKSKHGAIYQEPVEIRQVELIVNEATLVIQTVNPPKRSATLTFKFSSPDAFWKLFNRFFTEKR